MSDAGRDLVVGVGCRAGTDADHLEALVRSTLQRAGLAADAVAVVATVDTRAHEPGPIEVARRLGVPLQTHPLEVLAAADVLTPSAVVARHTGVVSVAEACVFVHGATLLVPKQRTDRATCAVGRFTG